MTDHNRAKWLKVEYRAGRGWFVVRTCPCHAGEAVTMPRPTEAAAISARLALIQASMVLGTNRLDNAPPAGCRSPSRRVPNGSADV